MVTSPYSYENCYGIFNVHTGEEGFAIMWSHLKDPYIVNCMELNLSTSERREGFVAPVTYKSKKFCEYMPSYSWSNNLLKNNKNNKVYDHQVDVHKNPLTLHHYHSCHIKVQMFVGWAHLPWSLCRGRWRSFTYLFVGLPFLEYVLDFSTTDGKSVI